jgi:hypothetical protein
MTEERLQFEIILWFNYTYPNKRGQLFHVNQKSRNSIEGNKMKSMGVVPGVSDLILIQQGKVLFIELKTNTGLQRPAQIKFQKMVELLGHQYHLIRSLDDFKKIV